jgi:hypothetical protein
MGRKVTKSYFLENKINSVKKWVEKGCFGQNKCHWSDLILHLMVIEFCPQNAIYVPYPEFEDAENESLPIIWHGAFFNLSSKTFVSKFSFEFVVKENLKKPLVTEDLRNLLGRYQGTSMLFLGFSCQETGNKIDKILLENPRLDKFIWPIWVMPFLDEPDEELKIKIKTRWSKILKICRPHDKILENELMNVLVTNKYSPGNCDIENIKRSIHNPILVSNRDFTYRKGFLKRP